LEIVKAAGYLEVRKPSLDFNRRLLERVTSLESTGYESYESPGSKRWPASALVLAGTAVACAVLLTFPYLKKEESHSLVQATNQITDLQEDFQPTAGGALSDRISANDDSLWQIFEDMDGLQTFNPEIIAREAKVYRRYVLPVVDVEGESSYTGESYLLTPVSTGVVQSADVVF